MTTAQANPDIHSLSTAFARAVDDASRSVVRVDRHRGTGSGIAWSDDLVITSSFHAPDRGAVAFVDAAGALVEREAVVVGRDRGTDVAALRVQGGGLTPARFRAIDGLAVGHLTLALARLGSTVRASLRIVGALSAPEAGEIRTPRGGRLARFVETDRTLPRGFGGGPLVDLSGEVLGMNTRTVLRDTDLVVPAATLRAVVDELVAHGGVRRGYAGIGAYPVALPADVARDVQQDSGAMVLSLEEGGPAALATVLVGDTVFRIAGAAVRGPIDLRDALVGRAGETVELELVRAGKRETLAITLGTRS